MHKEIALIFKRIVDRSPYTHFRCELIPSENGSNGFWGCKIHFDRRGDAHSEALVEALPLIGCVYGEGLFIEDNSKYLIVK